MNKYNNIPLNCFNTLITDKAKFDTLFKIEVEDPVTECQYVWVDPVMWDYGLDGKQLSSMSVWFYNWNKALFAMGLTSEQMKELDDISNTRLNFSHREGWRGGEAHAKNMAILYPPKKVVGAA